MQFQYLLIAIIITLTLFLFALGINKIARIFIGNYFAGFSAMISYLVVDTVINLVDSYNKTLNIHNPDLVAGFLMNNKTGIVLVIYFLFFILFYKSKLFEIEIKTFFQKLIGYLFFPILTVIELTFTILLVINGPSLLNYTTYQKVINSFDITNSYLLTFFNLIPLIIILVPIFVLLLFTNFNLRIKISMPSLRKKEKTNEEEKEEKQE